MGLDIMRGGVDRAHLEERESAGGSYHDEYKDDDREKLGTYGKFCEHERSQISNLRRKIDEQGRPSRIANVHGGFILCPRMN